MTNSQNMTSFTPGPWAIDGSEIVSKKQSRVIAEVCYIGGAERKANARLIAAAPELLESLKLFVDPFEGDELDQIADDYGLQTSRRVAQARAAIAKATS
jgi:hypothetical protein